VCKVVRAQVIRAIDSLADQIYTAIHFSMATAEDSSFDIWRSPSLIFNISANPHHRDARGFAERAGGSFVKMDKPVLKYYREHHLVHRPDMDRAFSRFYDYVRDLVGRLMRRMDGFESWRYDRIKEQPAFRYGWRRRMGKAPSFRGEEHGGTFDRISLGSA
jgi:hypothetical protein